MFKWVALLVLVASVATIVVTHLDGPDDRPAPPTIGQVERVITPERGRTTDSGNYLPFEPTKSGMQNHFHIAVRFVTDDVPILPPREVGLSVTKYYAIHTHDQSGAVHLHQPRDYRRFRLSDVWRAWGIDVTGRSFGGLSPYCIYRNGRPVKGNPLLNDLDDVQVSFAACANRPPLEPFDFSTVNFYQGESRGLPDGPSAAGGPKRPSERPPEDRADVLIPRR